MKGSIIVVLFFLAGVGIGVSGIWPQSVNASGCATGVLYLLMALVGFEFGHKSLAQTLRTLNLSALMVPLFSALGTLLMCVILWMIMGGWALTDFLAVGSGFGYYSLSSLIIIDIKSPEIGTQLATQLAAIALLTNLFREMLSLTCAPLFKKIGGPEGPVAAAAVTSLDVSLPIITRVSGQAMVPLAIINGIALEVTVPFLVTFFASL